jgi:DNA-binding NarL/FixJ family response regulator
MMDTIIKVLIVDDHKLISEAWSSLLKDAPSILVIGTADS